MVCVEIKCKYQKRNRLFLGGWFNESTYIWRDRVYWKEFIH